MKITSKKVKEKEKPNISEIMYMVQNDFNKFALHYLNFGKDFKIFCNLPETFFTLDNLKILSKCTKEFFDLQRRLIAAEAQAKGKSATTDLVAISDQKLMNRMEKKLKLAIKEKRIQIFGAEVKSVSMN